MILYKSQTPEQVYKLLTQGVGLSLANLFTICIKFPRINVLGIHYNKTMRDEQAEEIIEALKDYYANPEEYSIYDLEEIFQDRDPFEFL